jgi:acetyl esterase
VSEESPSASRAGGMAGVPARHRADPGLHPEVAAMLERSGTQPGIPAEAFRDRHAALRYLAAARPAITREPVTAIEPVAQVHDQSLPAGPSLRVYVPTGTTTDALLYLHGGGWVLGNLEMHDELCRRLANRAGVVVASLDYRLAPEHPFPAAISDCADALLWISDHLIAADGAIAVGGTSAGGNLAAAVALRSRAGSCPPVALQVLMYPALDPQMVSTTWREFGHGPFLTRDQMHWYWEQYVPDPEDRQNPLAAPSRAPDLRGLAPAIVVVGGCDPLSGEAVEYHHRLVEAGVESLLLSYPGQGHSFLRHLDVLSDADRAVTEISAGMRRLLAEPRTIKEMASREP